jgi:pectin methylesterase-like acyl-CoA thioesterase
MTAHLRGGGADGSTGHRRSVVAMTLLLTLTGCSSAASDRADLERTARDVAATPALISDLGPDVAVAEQIDDDGTVTATLTTGTATDRCFTATVTWPADWILDGTGTPTVAGPVPCEGTS